MKQPDQRSCGPSSLVAARMVVDPTYTPASFSDDVLALHRRITAPSAFGRTQLPWPRALGTPPWSAAGAMSEMTGIGYHTHVVRWGGRRDDLAGLDAAGAERRPCPLYVGSRWLPRHVVLVVATTSDDLQVYNPGRGTLGTVSRDAFLAGDVGAVTRWRTPWFLVSPRPRARRTPA
jgi:hypothetical protein